MHAQTFLGIILYISMHKFVHYVIIYFDFFISHTVCQSTFSYRDHPAHILPLSKQQYRALQPFSLSPGHRRLRWPVAFFCLCDLFVMSDSNKPCSLFSKYSPSIPNPLPFIGVRSGNVQIRA